MAKLRTVIDQSDGFMSGHQIVNARTYKRVTPAWTLDKKSVQALLLRSFPALASNDNQREAAARWASVIHLYFRMGYTYSQVAIELGSTPEKVEGVLRSIYRVSKGLRANDGSKREGKRGRPKKHAV